MAGMSDTRDLVQAMTNYDFPTVEDILTRRSGGLVFSDVRDAESVTYTSPHEVSVTFFHATPILDGRVAYAVYTPTDSFDGIFNPDTEKDLDKIVDTVREWARPYL